MADSVNRYMTKIVREMNKFAITEGKMRGIGSGEADLIHLVRHHPGISQQELSGQLGIDKSAVARQVKNLEKKGYIRCEKSDQDSRSKALYATALAASLKGDKNDIEERFYTWLFEDLSEEEKAAFFATLTKLYHRSKTESRSGFPHLRENKDE